MTGTDKGTVSVVIVNYKGAPDTIACLRAFSGIDWPADKIEFVVVDNASGDGSVAAIKASCPARPFGWVRYAGGGAPS